VTAKQLGRDDREACRGWIRAHSKSFYLSSLLLPGRVRQAAWALYAFCRRADDAVDGRVEREQALGRLDGLRRRLAAVYERDAAVQKNPIDRAFARVAQRYQIPRALPEALLAGMEMDALGTVYETDQDLLVYCFRVASTVGLMMTRVMGCSDELAYTRAADLGVAMQLTNIARDLGEDARRGRVYLPRQLCDELGIVPAELLTATEATPPMQEAVRRLLARAESHYRAADRGVPLLPRGCRFAIASSRQIYSAIGGAIARNGYDTIRQRAYVPLSRKLMLVARSLGAPLSTGGARSRQSVGPADAALSRLIVEVGLPAPRLLAQPERPERAERVAPP
jgi:phytoene synthase